MAPCAVQVWKLSMVCLHNNAIVVRCILVTWLHCGTPKLQLSAFYIVSSVGTSLLLSMMYQFQSCLGKNWPHRSIGNKTNTPSITIVWISGFLLDIQRSPLNLITDKVIILLIWYNFHAQNHLLCFQYYFDWLKWYVSVLKPC